MKGLGNQNLDKLKRSQQMQFTQSNFSYQNYQKGSKIYESQQKTRNSFTRKNQVPQTNAVYIPKQVKLSYESQNHLLNLQNRIQSVTAPKQIFDYLKDGAMQRFLNQIQVLLKNDSRINQVRQFFTQQQEFYKKLKFIITYGADSRQFYEDQSFNFFQQIPKIFNQILVQVSRRLKQFQSFKDGQKPYNNPEKVLDNFERFMKNIDDLKNDFESQNNRINKLKRQLNDKEQDIKRLQFNIYLAGLQSINPKQTSNESFQALYEQSKKNQQYLKSQIRKMESQIQYKNDQLSYLNQKVKKLNEENETLKVNSKNLVQKISKSDKIISTLNLEIKSFKLNASQPLIKKDIIDDKFNTQTKQIQQLKKELQKKQHQSQIIERNIHELSSTNIALLKKISQLQHQLKQPSIKKEQDNSKYILESSDLIGYNQTIFKSRLQSMIVNYLHRKPIQFKLLFKFQKSSYSNFHSSVDGRSNFLILIKLYNGVVIGGFCPSPLVKGGGQNGGFLFSLTLGCMYPLIFGKPCFTYDQYYFQMGNAQIRIKIGEDTLYSNFGIQNKHFDSSNHRISHFFHGSDQVETHRQIFMTGYEIYEVIFNY